MFNIVLEVIAYMASFRGIIMGRIWKSQSYDRREINKRVKIPSFWPPFSLDVFLCQCISLDHSVFPDSNLKYFWLKFSKLLLPFCFYCYCSATKPKSLPPMDYSKPGSSVLHYILKFAQIYVHWVCYLTTSKLCHPLLLLPSILTSIKDFSSESTLCIRWPNYWRFIVSSSPSSEYSGLISFRINWLDLLLVQETLKSLLQYHNSKASILWWPVFMDQISHSCMTTEKATALTIWIFVDKVMSLMHTVNLTLHWSWSCCVVSPSVLNLSILCDVTLILNVQSHGGLVYFCSSVGICKLSFNMDCFISFGILKSFKRRNSASSLDI